MLNKNFSVDYDYFDKLCQENIELPMDIDYSLPDYCPDIKKILKCTPCVELCSYTFTQDRIMCEGKLSLYVWYMDENSDTIRLCEITKEFHHSGEIKSCDEKTVPKITAKTGHIICRAISARKLDIHLPINLEICITAQKKTKIYHEQEELEKKVDTINISRAISSFNQIFTVENELELSQSLMPIDCILRKNIAINSIKYSVQEEKIQIDALADITLVYRSFSENSSLQKVSFTVPFTQILEEDFRETDCVCNLEIDTHEFSVSPKEDSSGEYTICDLYLKLCASISVYKDISLDLIVDAYSCQKDCKTHYRDINFCKYDGQHQEKLSFVKSIFLADDEIEKLLDCWCEDISISSYCEKNKISYRGKFSLCLIYKGKSSSVFCLTKVFDFSHTREFDEMLVRKCEANVKVQIKDFRISDGNNVEFSLDGILTSNDYSFVNKKILDSCEICEQENCNNDCITLYYCQNNENLWDIGKKYSKPVSSIIQNNNLADEHINSGTALIIY